MIRILFVLKVLCIQANIYFTFKTSIWLVDLSKSFKQFLFFIHLLMFNKALNFISIQVVSFALAFLFSLLFEVPILSLEKLIFHRKH